MKTNIKDIKMAEWHGLFTTLGLKKYTAAQVYQWLYKKRVTSFDEMTNLSKDARTILNEKFYISRLELLETLEDTDGTKKFLYKLEDGNKIESVLIPKGRTSPFEKGGRGDFIKGRVPGHSVYGVGVESPRKRQTLCISSQVGCALGCDFCRTAEIGFIRNLKSSEILDQLLTATEGTFLKGTRPRSQRLQGGGDRESERVTNLVFMGMGEPLNNYDNVREAIKIIIDPNGLGLVKRRVTISTAGVVPGIEKMVRDNLGVKLALSLNATTDEVRARIMPVAKKYSIEEILNACKLYHPFGTRLRTTIEYVLIDGVNDSMEDAQRLAELMKKLPSKLNLIPFNPFPGSRFGKPKGKVLKEFYNYLYNKGIQVNTRQSRGQNILAACGQLATK